METTSIVRFYWAENSDVLQLKLFCFLPFRLANDWDFRLRGGASPPHGLSEYAWLLSISRLSVWWASSISSSSPTVHLNLMVGSRGGMVGFSIRKPTISHRSMFIAPMPQPLCLFTIGCVAPALFELVPKSRAVSSPGINVFISLQI